MNLNQKEALEIIDNFIYKNITCEDLKEDFLNLHDININSRFCEEFFELQDIYKNINILSGGSGNEIDMFPFLFYVPDFDPDDIYGALNNFKPVARNEGYIFLNKWIMLADYLVRKTHIPIKNYKAERNLEISNICNRIGVIPYIIQKYDYYLYGIPQLIRSDDEERMNIIRVLSDNYFINVSDKTVDIYNSETGIKERVILHYSPNILAAIIINNKIIIANGSQLKILNYITGIVDFMLHSETDDIFSIVNLSNNIIASGSFEGNICLFDLDTKTEISSLSIESSLEVMVSLQKFIILSSSDQKIHIWNTKSDQHFILEGLYLKPFINILSKDKFTIITSDGLFEIWNINSLKKEMNTIIFENQDDDSPVVSSVLIDSNKIFIGSSHGDIKIYEPFSKIYERDLYILDRYISDMILLPNNQLVSLSSDSQIDIWDLDTYQIIRSFKVPFEDRSKLLLLPNGRFISGGFRLWM